MARRTYYRLVSMIAVVSVVVWFMLFDTASRHDHGQPAADVGGGGRPRNGSRVTCAGSHCEARNKHQTFTFNGGTERSGSKSAPEKSEKAASSIIRKIPARRHKNPSMNETLMRSSLDYLLNGLDKSLALSANRTRPIDAYLANYRNPCWVEKLPENFRYPNASGRRWPGGRLAKHLQAEYDRMMAIYAQRRRDGEGWRMRCLPYVYLIGTYKAGTTDFYANLVEHELIEENRIKEPYFWTNVPPVRNSKGDVIQKRGAQTFDEYLNFYDEAAERIRQHETDDYFHPKITIDAATWTFLGYMRWFEHPWNKGAKEQRITLPQHLSYLSPQSRYILMVREPLSFMTSCYNFFKIRIQNFYKADLAAIIDSLVVDEINSFKECAKANPKSVTVCYYDASTYENPCHVKNVVYYVLVKEWMSAVGSERLMVINSDAYYADRVPTIVKALKFLKLSPMASALLDRIRRQRVRNKVGHGALSDMMRQETIDALSDFVQPWNKKLSEYLDDDSYLWKAVDNI